MKTAAIYILDIRGLEGREQQVLPLLTESRRKALQQPQPEQDRLHSMAAGLLLRQVLDVRQDGDLICGEWGKPELRRGSPRFSLSHGGNYAVLAVHTEEIGVDIEPVPEKTPVISRRFLHPEELEWLKKDPSPERFAHLWTQLESVLKADGRGLALEDRRFSVLEDNDWSIRTFDHDGHVISCAAKEPFEPHPKALCCDDLMKNRF